MYGRTIYESISRIVDQIFNQYVRRSGQLAPFFTSFCNGTTVTCAGLSQWGTVSLANQGRNALQILRYYYPSDVEISQTNIITGIVESFPGETLRVGSRGLAVETMQTYLNRIRKNYPAIPLITDDTGVFGPRTEAAVKEFQRIFNMAVDGVIGKATWNRITQIYVAIARLAELDSEGTSLGIGTVPPNTILRVGSSGVDVVTLQYILSFIGEFYPNIPNVTQDGIFGSQTAAAVIEFQRMMGLTADGVVTAATWNALYDVYWGVRNNAPIPAPTPPATEYFEHVVVSGDSLWALAQRYGTTVAAIKSLSGITSDALTIGQVLRIPRTGVTPPATEYFEHVVVSGDSLWALAQRYGTTVAAIKSLSGITSDALTIGQVLRIPRTGVTPPTTPTPPTTNYFTYTVRSGDNLWVLAQRFGTTVDAIKSLNNLTSDALSIGQVLKIPGNVVTHTVVSGDSLWALAQRYGTTVDAIKALNGLTSNSLAIGQTLIIRR